MSENITDLLHSLLDGSNLTKDQQQVVENYFFRTGRVCVDAGAGTGKTTTLIEILSYIVISEHIHFPENNPFEKILVLSFGREASRQLKVKLKNRLKEIQNKSKVDISEDIYRWLETESFIQTIDSYLIGLLKEVSQDIKINPLFDVAPLLDTDMIIAEIEEEMRRDNAYKNVIEELESIYPARNLDYGSLPGLFEMLTLIHQKTREFCWVNDEYNTRFLDSVGVFFSNHQPPFKEEEVTEILIALTSDKNISKLSENSKEDYNRLKSNLEIIYNTLKHNYEMFAMLLDKYDMLYTEKSKKNGVLTYIDIAYLLWRYLEEVPDSLWFKSLKLKFNHILIDEFQDTSFVQCRIMSHLIRNSNTPEERNKIMIIGDVKQSIYQWRSAEPGIFSSIIEYAKYKEKTDLTFEIEEAEYVALTSNFRSQEEIIYLVNELFSKSFDNSLTGRIGKTKVDYVALNPTRCKFNNNTSQKSIHVLFTEGSDKKREYWSNWKEKDANKLVAVIKDILEGDTQIKIYDDKTQENERDPLPGDIALLFRRKSSIPYFLNLFNTLGIDYSLILDNSLFLQHEISLLVDFLDWFANPHNKYALLHILRSPLIAISDETLRFLASHNFMLRKALAELEEKQTELKLKKRDVIRLKSLMKLRNDLRWDREGEKTALIDKIINHGALDIVFLASSSSSFETLANIQLFIELVKEWEEEELLSYNQFVTQIKILRDRAYSGIKDYSTIKFGDYESKNSVKIMTIHASKGLEFPIVVIPDLIVKDSFQQIFRERLLLDREIGIAIKPVNIPLNDISNFELDGPGKGTLIPRELSSGIFWIHYKRDKTGNFAYSHPYNEFIKKQISEYWRLFYVATTRARDHLIFHLGQIEPIGDVNSTWMYALQRSLGFLKKEGFDYSVNEFTVDLKWKQQIHTTEGIKTDEIEKEINIDMLIPSDREYNPVIYSKQDTESLDKKDKIRSLNVLQNIQFVPTSIAAKNLYSLQYCPRRYAFAVLNRIDNYFLSGKFGEEHLPPGSSPPEGIHSASEWGDIVHQGFEKIHELINKGHYHLDEENKVSVTEEIDNESAKRAFLDIANIYLNNEEINLLLKNRKTELFTEYELYAHYEYEDYDPIIINGTIDLLFQTNDDKWIVLDYKTGTPPVIDSDLFSMYENQLTTYVWLLKQNYPEIEEIDAKLVFVHPEFKIIDVNKDLLIFEKELEEAIREKTKIHEAQGFMKYPNKTGEFSRCKTCPYSISVGGPCEE